LGANPLGHEVPAGDVWRSPGADIVRGRHVHFMGIGGIGVSALAHLARAAGAVVSGCDAKLNDIASGFAREGCRVFRGHSPEHLGGVDLLVRTSATRPDEPELLAARAQGIPVFDRLPMLLRLAQGRKLLGVAGSHGKTTTSALAAAVLIQAGLDPSCVIGGVVDTIGSNARAGGGEWFIAEIDESDGYVAEAACDIAILTNVDREHLDRYATLDDVRRAFAAFLSNVRDGGFVVACADSVPVLDLARASGKRVAAYGLSQSAEFRAEVVELGAEGSRFRAVTPSGAIENLYLSRVGVHAVQNAMAVVAAAAELGIDEGALRRAFEHAPKVGRRWEEHELPRGVRMIVDYAHHPAEVAATVAAARLGAKGRLVAVFQPHRYTRTRELGEEFGPAFAGDLPQNLAACAGSGAGVDELIVMPVYAASEDAIPGVTGEVVADSAFRAGVTSTRYVESRNEALEALARTLREGDTLLVLGAGDVNTLADDLLSMPW
jgi:UDP-N-acetylmuramate--alanine ligase